MAEETGASAPYQQESSKSNVVYLGIDLGTANSSIATSTSIKRTVPSVVGWPKDLISYKFIQKPIVFGEECIRNRMALDLVYPLENGILKYRTTNGGDTNEREAIAGGKPPPAQRAGH
jgi:rod shape-determining protein MreB